MFKRICMIVMACALLAAFLAGCGSEPEVTTSPKETTESGICPPMVMIDGELYCDWTGWTGSDPRISIEEDQILGYITSVVAITGLPTQNGEANYDNAMGAPYARWTDEEYGEVYVIKYGYGWHILTAAE